ncbi:MAG: hypothetical protein CMN60_21170 [Sphingobium sp.]|nr:hypothetical protein [Sphingobium sp.]MBS50143.1 hypothetical protein [Sphingobium sp.]|tara:strand:- start:251536 stop:251811 length:276 start_codon:yes stop_codon:yes gene_type:complete
MNHLFSDLDEETVDCIGHGIIVVVLCIAAVVLTVYLEAFVGIIAVLLALPSARKVAEYLERFEAFKHKTNIYLRIIFYALMLTLMIIPVLM